MMISPRASSLLALVFLFFLGCQAPSNQAKQENPSFFVDPFIGTDGPGNTYPGATVPFGMVQLSPDNGRSGWDWIAGYFYPDTVIAGFSHLHLSGTGAGDLYDLSFFAYTGEPKRSANSDLGPKGTPYSLFSHEQEKASPGYYQVNLLDYDISAEMTATHRTGLQCYTFGKAAEATIRLNLGYARNWDWVTDAQIELVNDTTLVGYRKSSGWAKDQQVFFYSVLSEPCLQYQIINEGKITKAKANGKALAIEMAFHVKANDQVLIKTGISSVSIANAKENLEAEQKGFNFEETRQKAKDLWNEQLTKIQIASDTNNLVKFYTSLYHSMLGPTLFSDVNGEYKGPDGLTHRAASYTRYATFSLWDTYRATHPLATLLHPNRTIDFIQSMLNHYQETGLLPVWELLGNETNMMMGYHAVPVISDAILKNMKGFDWELAFTAMKKSASGSDNGLEEYRKLGYVPYETRSWNVSLTMEYAFDDWCIAEVAKKLGHMEDHAYYLGRSEYYKNHFDPVSGFMRAKDSLGNYRPNFNPNSYKPDDYCEANAWHYNWYVPHDVPGMIDLMGGKEATSKLLDRLFTEEQEVNESTVWISGYFGQYVHGNEPSHHVPYLFQYLDQPEKTSYWVRKIMDELYTTNPDGLCGNEDFGQMSAWYVFSALGFYPMNPTGGEYVIGSPNVDEAIVQLPDGKQIIIKVKNQAKDHTTVARVTWNDSLLEKPIINHHVLMEGGRLVFEMEKPEDL